MTIEELFKFMNEELKGCSGYVFFDRQLSELRSAMEERKHFQAIKFKDWFVSKNVVYKNSPLSFLAKCGLQDVESGVFDKEHISAFVTPSLLKDFRRRGICYRGEDTLRLDVYLLYVYNHDLLTMDDILSWLEKAVDFVENSSKNASEFETLFQKSITMKRLRLPYKELEAHIKQSCNEWSVVIKSIEDMKTNCHDFHSADLGTAIPESETQNETQQN